MSPTLEVKNLEVRFLSDRAMTYAVNGISFDVNADED